MGSYSIIDKRRSTSYPLENNIIVVQLIFTLIVITVLWIMSRLVNCCNYSTYSLFNIFTSSSLFSYLFIDPKDLGGVVEIKVDV